MPHCGPDRLLAFVATGLVFVILIGASAGGAPPSEAPILYAETGLNATRLSFRVFWDALDPAPTSGWVLGYSGPVIGYRVTYCYDNGENSNETCETHHITSSGGREEYSRVIRRDSFTRPRSVSVSAQNAYGYGPAANKTFYRAWVPEENTPAVNLTGSINGTQLYFTVSLIERYIITDQDVIGCKYRYCQDYGEGTESRCLNRYLDRNEGPTFETVQIDHRTGIRPRSVTVTPKNFFGYGSEQELSLDHLYAPQSAPVFNIVDMIYDSRTPNRTILSVRWHYPNVSDLIVRLTGYRFVYGEYYSGRLSEHVQNYSINDNGYSFGRQVRPNARPWYVKVQARNYYGLGKEAKGDWVPSAPENLRMAESYRHKEFTWDAPLKGYVTKYEVLSYFRSNWSTTDRPSNTRYVSFPKAERNPTIVVVKPYYYSMRGTSARWNEISIG